MAGSTIPHRKIAVVLCAALAAAASSTAITGALAQSAAIGTAGSNLILLPNEPESEAALRSSSARVLAIYGAFTLVEAEGADVKRLLKAGGELRDEMRELQVGTMRLNTGMPDAGLSKTGQAMRAADKGGFSMAVVQFVGPIKPEWLDKVRGSGVQLVSYMSHNAYLVAGTGNVVSGLSGLTAGGFVRAVIPYSASVKTARNLLGASGKVPVVISTVAGLPGATSRATIAGMSTPVGESVNVAGIVQQRAIVDAGSLPGITELGGVVSVEREIAPRLFDERAGKILTGVLTPAFQPKGAANYRQYLINNGFTTNSPVIIDITDEGVDKGVVPVPAGSHPAFFRNGNPASPSRIVYAHEATQDSNARDCGGHGTNVASIATGFSTDTGATHEDAQGYNFALGIQPFGKLGATKIFNCAGSFDVQTSVPALHSQAFAAGARISNNSWGAAVNGAYNATSQQFDTLVRDARSGAAGNQQFVEVVAAGNQGPGGNTIGSPATAKNVITVGAAENVRPIGGSDGCGVPDSGANSARDIINFSSRGPTDDGRIKPDVVAPGTHMAGAQPQTGTDYNGSGTCDPVFPAGSTLYNLVSGTSQATPVVTGFASLIFTWYKDLFGAGNFPSPALTKALMINTATDLAGGDNGNGGTIAPIPNTDQGWGRVNLGNLLDGTSRRVVDQTTRFAATGNATNTFFNIASPSDPLRVSLVWTDIAGPTTGNALVNDLDLLVTAGGNTYKGNVFAGGRSVGGGIADPINNVENVFLPPGITGPVKVRVVAKNIAGDGVPGNADTTDQDYALVVSNVGAPVPSTPVIEFAGNTLSPKGDGDAFVEPGEPFTLAVNLKNVGNANATAVSATLSAPPGDANITQPDASWPTIQPNQTKSNATPLMRGTVKADATCGSTLNLTVAGTASGTPFSVPIHLPIGKPGKKAQNFPSADVPKSIPDGSLTGVTSTVSLGGGVVSDLKVTIQSLTHTWISDITIDLTSPRGTVVQLFNRQGGSGDNLVNTVFSDDAATSIASGIAPFTGTFRPVQPLSAFDGEPGGGTWTLRVRDLVTQDAGTLQNWKIARKKYECN